MADEGTVPGEAMECLKEAGQYIKATQSPMRSEDMIPMARTSATFLRAFLRRSP